MPVKQRNGWAGSGGKAMGRGVSQGHSMSYYEDGEQGEAIRRMRTLPSLSLPSPVRDQKLGEKGGTRRGRDSAETPENIRRGRREGRGSWHRLQEREPTALGH